MVKIGAAIVSLELCLIFTCAIHVLHVKRDRGLIL